MKLSIVLVNYRGWKRLRQCLESLQCLEKASFEWEVIIIDNQSRDNSLPEFIADFPSFTFFENSGNFGFAHGCNTGALKSTGDFIFFLNPDTIVTLDALQTLLQVAESHPEISILSCRQLNDHGKDTRPYGLFLRPATLTSLLRSLYRSSHKNQPTQSTLSGLQAIHPEWLSGSAIFMSRNNFIASGGWSEDFWMYYEDADLCKRIQSKGGTIALLNDVQIIHNHGGASRINIPVKALTKCEVLISRHVYVHKHFAGFTRMAIQSYLIINNALLGQLLMAVIGTLLSFKKSMRVYPKLYSNIIGYYIGAARNKTWISPRSVNYKKESST